MLGVGERTLFRMREEVKASHFSGGKLATALRKRPRKAEERGRSAKFYSFTVVRAEVMCTRFLSPKRDTDGRQDNC
ncbi:hypothetical protein MRX96_027920 [Rhipicephalus microplus]